MTTMAGGTSKELEDFSALYATLTAEITAAICRLDNSRDEGRDAVSGQIGRLERNFEEADELIEQMELEIRALPGEAEVRRRRMNQLESVRAEKKRLLAQFRSSKRRGRTTTAATPSSGATSAGLVPDGLHSGGDEEDLDDDPKQRLLENSETLERAGRKLEVGQQLLVETESIGAAVLNDLALQREQIGRSRNRLRDMDQDLGASSRILSQIITRARQSKVVLALVAAVILLAIVAGIYLSFKG